MLRTVVLGVYRSERLDYKYSDREMERDTKRLMHLGLYATSFDPGSHGIFGKQPKAPFPCRRSSLWVQHQLHLFAKAFKVGRTEPRRVNCSPLHELTLPRVENMHSNNCLVRTLAPSRCGQTGSSTTPLRCSLLKGV